MTWFWPLLLQSSFASPPPCFNPLPIPKVYKEAEKVVIGKVVLKSPINLDSGESEMIFQITEGIKNAKVDDKLKIVYFQHPAKCENTDCQNAMLTDPEIQAAADDRYLLFLKKWHGSTYERIGLNCGQQEVAIGRVINQAGDFLIRNEKIPKKRLRAFLLDK